MKELQLKKLEESYEAGIIDKEEYEKKKKEIEESIEEERVKEEEDKTEKKEPEEEEKIPIKSEKMLFVLVGIVVLIIAGFFVYNYITQQQAPKTIDDLHLLNLEGKLPEDQGFVYDGVHSFVKQDDVWYTLLSSDTGLTEFNLNFRYSPLEVEDIPIEGVLDIQRFNDAENYSVTFNPLGEDLSHIRLARFDFDTQMLKVFDKIPMSACDRNASNQTAACAEVPIMTCDNEESMVMHYKEAPDLRIEYDDNCIIIEGREFDFIKGVDRVLYNLYGIMEQ